MKIQFENVGRDKKTWISEYPGEVSLESACENETWWINQLRGAMRSSPDWEYCEKKNCVNIFAGFYCVGVARLYEGKEND